MLSQPDGSQLRLRVEDLTPSIQVFDLEGGRTPYRLRQGKRVTE